MEQKSAEVSLPAPPSFLAFLLDGAGTGAGAISTCYLQYDFKIIMAKLFTYILLTQGRDVSLMCFFGQNVFG